MIRRTELTSWGRKYFFGLLFPLVLLVSLNYHQSLLYPTDLSSFLYYLLTGIGHYGLIVALLYFLLYWPITFLKQATVARVWAILISFIFLFFVFADSMIFAQYRYHLNKFVFEMVFSSAFSDIFEFPFIFYFFVIAGVLLLITALWFCGSFLWRIRAKKVKYWYLVAIIFSLLGSNLIHAYARAMSVSSITSVASLYPVYYPLTANRFLKRMGIISEQATNFSTSNNNDFFYPHGELNCQENRSMNFLFIVVDSWRFDQLDPYIMEYLYEYQKTGMNFKNHFSGSNSTRAGIFSLFYGLPSIYWSNALNNQKPPVVMDQFRKSNYDFGIFASASLTMPEFDRTVFAQIPNLRVDTNADGSVARDLLITKEWKEWLSKRNKESNPFFGFLFYDSPHSYTFPPDFQKHYDPIANSMNYLILNNNLPTLPLLNLHHKSASFVDTLIKEVVEDLKKKGLDKNTVVIITGDHGQELNDNKKNFWGHNGNFSPFQIQVPMVIKWPNKESFTHSGHTGHYDIAPTIMKEYFNCQAPAKNYSYGESLLEKINHSHHIVGSYIDYAVLDFERNHITTVNKFGDYSATDFKLNPVTKKEINNQLLLNVFKDLTRFKRPQE